MVANSQKKYERTLTMVNKMYGQLPGFTDVFDEETWYIFVILFIVATVLAAVVISRFVKLRDVE